MLQLYNLSFGFFFFFFFTQSPISNSMELTRKNYIKKFPRNYVAKPKLNLEPSNVTWVLF